MSILKQTIIGFLALTVLAVVFIVSPSSGSISPEEALELLRGGATVIDVRSSYEWAMYNMAHKGVISIPMDSLR
jgi:hypothetical protein